MIAYGRVRALGNDHSDSAGPPTIRRYNANAARPGHNRTIAGRYATEPTQAHTLPYNILKRPKTTCDPADGLSAPLLGTAAARSRAARLTAPCSAAATPRGATTLAARLAPTRASRPAPRPRITGAIRPGDGSIT